MLETFHDQKSRTGADVVEEGLRESTIQDKLGIVFPLERNEGLRVIDLHEIGEGAIFFVSRREAAHKNCRFSIRSAVVIRVSRRTRLSRDKKNFNT